MQIHFFVLFTSSSGKFPARRFQARSTSRPESSSSERRALINTCEQLLNTWLPEMGASSWSCFNKSLHSSLRWEKKRRRLSGALCFDVGKSLTWGTEFWVNDGDEWNTNLGLVPDNNRCVAKAFISISDFHLEIQAAFGNSFIRRLRHLMCVSTQLC